MALKLKLCTSIGDNCTSLILTDSTEEYNSSTNTGGWGSPNISSVDVVESYITIVSSDPNDRGLRYDIDTNDFPTTITGAFPLITISDYKFNDGEYQIVYTVVTADNTEYEAKAKIFITCGVACCVHKLWLNYINKDLPSSCSCNTTNELKDVMVAESLYRALLMAAACLDTKTRDRLLIKLQAICDYTNCNCS